MVIDGPVPAIESRVAGATHRLEMNGSLIYRAPGLTATVDPDTWEVVEAAADGGGEHSLRPAADLYVLLRSLLESAPHLPAAAAGGTRVGHPGYGV